MTGSWPAAGICSFATVVQFPTHAHGSMSSGYSAYWRRRQALWKFKPWRTVVVLCARTRSNKRLRQREECNVSSARPRSCRAWSVVRVLFDSSLPHEKMERLRDSYKVVASMKRASAPLGSCSAHQCVKTEAGCRRRPAGRALEAGRQFDRTRSNFLQHADRLRFDPAGRRALASAASPRPLP